MMLLILKLKVKVDVVVVLPAFGNEVLYKTTFHKNLVDGKNPRQDTPLLTRRMPP